MPEICATHSSRLAAGEEARQQVERPEAVLPDRVPPGSWAGAGAVARPERDLHQSRTLQPVVTVNMIDYRCMLLERAEIATACGNHAAAYFSAHNLASESTGSAAMRLTVYTDYSLRLLIYAALEPDGLVNISEVADAYGISRNHLTKVVHQLGHRRLPRDRSRQGRRTAARAPAFRHPCRRRRALHRTRHGADAVLQADRGAVPDRCVLPAAHGVAGGARRLPRRAGRLYARGSRRCGAAAAKPARHAGVRRPAGADGVCASAINSWPEPGAPHGVKPAASQGRLPPMSVTAGVY